MNFDVLIFLAVIFVFWCGAQYGRFDVQQELNSLAQENDELRQLLYSNIEVSR